MSVYQQNNKPSKYPMVRRPQLIGAFKEGGDVKKTGAYKLHKGEKVIPAKEKGEKPITFKKGGEHKSLGVPAGQKIPAKKHAEAAAGKFGPKAKKQENFRNNVLVGRRRMTSDGSMKA